MGSDNTASLSNIARALQWVIDNHSQYNITVVNMSFSDGGNYAHNWFAQDGGSVSRSPTLSVSSRGCRYPWWPRPATVSRGSKAKDSLRSWAA